MEGAKELFLCFYNKKDYSDEPYMSKMLEGHSIQFGEDNNAIKSEGYVYENGKRGFKLLFIDGDYQEERVLFVGDTATFTYSYVDITGPTDWDDEFVHVYLKVIEK